MQAKSIFRSKTIWGVVIAAAPTIANTISGIFGGQIAPGDAQIIVESVEGLITIGGALLAVYGRYRASAPVALRAGK